MPKKKKSSEKKGSLVHIKLEYSEAKEGKKALLSSEINLLRASKNFSNYKDLRLKELDKKREILQKIKQIKTNLGNLQVKFPKIKMPKILQKEDENVEEEKKIYVSPIKKGNVESQLLEIQKKLKLLEG